MAFIFPKRTLIEKFVFFIKKRIKVLSDFWWWFKYRIIPKHKHHILKIGKPGYSDVCEKLIHANFILLRSFVENERGLKVIAWDSDPIHKHAGEEIRDLYNWYVFERPFRDEKNSIYKVDMPDVIFKEIDDDNGKQEKLYEMVPNSSPEIQDVWNKACDELHSLEQQWDEEDCRNLKRLADIRLFLWT